MSILAIRLPEIIGLTILHTLWQITLLWIVLVAVLRLWPRASSAVRYTLAISTLMLSVLTTAATAVYEWQLPATTQEISTLTDRTTQSVHTVYITVKQTLLSTMVDALNASVPILAWLWCAGLIVMGSRFSGSFFYLRKLRARENIIATSPVWEQEVKRLSIAIGLRREVAMATSTRISSPLTLGSFAPIILVPAGLLSGMPGAQLEAILVHELYHIQRRDYIINICQALVEVLLFYHPAIWHINKIIREERESCCDDQTVAFCGDAITYARALTQIQEINTLTKPTLAMSATGTNTGNFSNRIKRLFNIYPNPAQARSKGIFSIGVLIVYLGIVLASAKVSTARPVGLEKKDVIPFVINDYNTFSSTFSDSIVLRNHLHALNEKEITPQPAASEKIRSMNIQPADTTVGEQSLEKCLQKVRLLLKMVSIYRSPGDRFKYTNFSEEDSLRIARSVNLHSNITLQPQFYETVHLTQITPLDIVDTTDNETPNIYANQQEIDPYGDVINGGPVQVFPNSANGDLNIRFTPARNNSRVKMVLVDSDGTVVKEITDTTYDHIPTALHVDVSSYRKGIYVLQINIDGSKSQRRVVVE